MNTTILSKVINNKAVPCVSVIVPTHKTSPDRTIDALEVNKAIKKAEQLLQKKYNKEEKGTILINKLKELLQQVDYMHNDEGIGFFVSSETAQIIKFPFSVKEKIVVGDSFEIRDVLFLAKIMTSYYVLLLNEKEIKLFEGAGENLKPVNDGNFPHQIFDDYEYSHTSPGSSYGYALKSTEKDKSVVKEQRLMAHIKQVDKKIPQYLAGNIPLILCGSSKDLGYFNKNSSHNKSVVGKITGNYIHENIEKLGKLSFEKINNYLNAENNATLAQLNELSGKKLIVFGIKDVWKAAKEGKGLILVVEKDYSCPGFITNKDDSKIFLNPPEEQHEILTDVVDDLMEMVIEKKGNVMVVENGKLASYDGIAMILRY